MWGKNKFGHILAQLSCNFNVTSIFTARKRSLGQGNIFAPVCHSVHMGGLPQCILGYPPPGSRHPPPPSRHHHPQEQIPPWEEIPPGSRHNHPPPPTHPARSRHQPLRSACWEIRSTSGRHASHWNAILLLLFFLSVSTDSPCSNLVQPVFWYAQSWHCGGNTDKDYSICWGCSKQIFGHDETISLTINGHCFTGGGLSARVRLSPMLEKVSE